MVLALFWPAAGYAQQTAEELYQAGLYQEEVQGDLERAIQLYKELVDSFPTARAVAAKAQLHIGLCYEKLGLTGAREAYRNVIDDFPDQRDEVAVAQQRLASLAQELAELRRGPTFTKIEIASKPQNGVLSPDGTKLAFVSDGGVWTVPLEGNVGPNIAGEPVRIADVPDAWDNGSLHSWSADGEWIAVNSWGGDEVSVYIIPATGGEPRAVSMPVHGGGVAWNLRLGLSPDGQRMAFSAVEPGSPEPLQPYQRYTYVISTAGGEPEQLSSGWASMPAFSADGAHVAYVGFRERDDWQEEDVGHPFTGDLWVVPSDGGTPANIANASGVLRGPVWSPDGRFIAAHHQPGRDADSREVWVFPLSADRSSASDPIKIGLPRSSWNIVAGWTPDDALGIFIESESHMALYTVPASGGRAVQTTPDGYAWYPRWSADGERIYFRSWRGNPDGVSIGYTAATGGDVVDLSVRSERQLVSVVPGAGFNVSPDGEKIVFSAYQAPYDPEEGVDVWAIPLDGGRPTRLTSDRSREGYPCWSPDGEWVAFLGQDEQSEGEGVGAIFLVPAQGGEVRQLSVESDSVGDGAIAFSPDGERIAFFSNGTIKTMPVHGGRAEALVSAPETNWRSQLVWSPDGRSIAYSAAGEIWVASADGGEAVKLSTSLPEGTRHGDFSWSPDGERIAFAATRGGEPEFWLISDFLPNER
jgi:Tol biopolymer transport system component